MRDASGKFRPTTITLITRVLLLIALVSGIAIVLFDGFTKGWNAELFNQSEDTLRITFFAGLALSLTFIFNLAKKRRDIFFPNAIEISVVIFIFAAQFLGSGVGLYEQFWWFDDLLHTISGIIIALIGSLLGYYLNVRHKLNMDPIFVAIFAFCFATTVGVAWEIYEFSSDVFIGTNMQRWDAPNGTPIMGNSYQGNGLRDTMSDLIVASAGALVASSLAYYFYKYEGRPIIKIII